MTQSFMYITLTPRKNFFHIPSFNIPHISSIHSKLEWNLNKCNVMLEQMTSKHARLSNDPNDRQQLRNIMVLICFCIIVVVSCFTLLLLIWNALKINEKNSFFVSLFFRALSSLQNQWKEKSVSTETFLCVSEH